MCYIIHCESQLQVKASKAKENNDVKHAGLTYNSK